MASSSDLSGLLASVGSDSSGAGRMRSESERWDRLSSGDEMRGTGMVRTAEQHFAEFLSTIGGQPEWMADALCTQIDGDLFFPEVETRWAEARKVCAMCPVREQCLEWALGQEFSHGIVGGTSARERNRIRDERGVA
ncbi:WhiB family transcriptional regulator [Gordonia sp. DT219]|uniref:WhiB family transcriptional regulator n=1 Tax=Gordonia sp. DT219 TaxID=3416658 RepID=UPI003CFA0C92